MTPFSAIGLELWSMTSDIFFDNFIICGDRRVVDDWASDGWGLKKAADGAAEVCACLFLGIYICNCYFCKNLSSMVYLPLFGDIVIKSGRMPTKDKILGCWT